MNNQHLKFFIRFGYVAVIIVLYILMTHGAAGPNPKGHSEIKASIQMLMIDQPVDSNKRLHVSNYFGREFSDGRAEILGFDPLPVLKKIRDGGTLSDSDKQQLSKMVNLCSALSN